MVGAMRRPTPTFSRRIRHFHKALVVVNAILSTTGLTEGSPRYVALVAIRRNETAGTWRAHCDDLIRQQISNAEQSVGNTYDGVGQRNRSMWIIFALLRSKQINA
jgi:hypothetical protein